MDPRRKNDLVQKQKQADVLTNTLRYVMGTPCIQNPGYVPDIRIRPQYWVGNVRENGFDINNHFAGLGQRSVRGGTELPKSIMDPSHHSLKSTHVVHIPVKESRLDEPAWAVQYSPANHQIQYSFRPMVVRPAVPISPIHSRREYLERYGNS
jgi:hypothetical protein